MKSFAHPKPGEVIIHTAPDFLQTAFERLRSSMQPAECAGYDVSRIYLMLDEILSNIYKHGYGRKSGEPVGVQVQVQADTCVITTRDLAPTFDSALHARTRVLPDPDTGAPGGRGLVIVYRLCESFEHESLPDGGNALRLVMKLIARPGAQVAGSRPRTTAKTRE